jgi:hypothetical protein
MGAMLISLFSASPTPAQVGAAPTPTFVTAGNSTPVPTSTPTPHGGAPTAQASNPVPTVNFSNLGGSGVDLSQFPGLSGIALTLAPMQTIVAQGGGAMSLAGASSGGVSSQLGGATPTPVPGMITPTSGTPQTPAATAPTAVTVVAFTATPTATLALGAPTPTATEVVAMPVATADALPTQPMISIDTPEAGGILANGRAVLVGGWIVDPRAEGAGVVAVDVFVDGQPGSGTFVGAADQDLNRDDVAMYFQRPDWDRSGFQLEWTPRGLGPGQHSIYVIAQLSAGGSVASETQVSVR